MARVIFISRKNRNAIFAPLHRLVRQVSAAGSYSYSASRYSYSYSRRYSDTPLVRCISRVSIDTIRFRSVGWHAQRLCDGRGMLRERSSLAIDPTPFPNRHHAPVQRATLPRLLIAQSHALRRLRDVPPQPSSPAFILGVPTRPAEGFCDLIQECHVGNR
jgi:hypothetical protein